MSSTSSQHIELTSIETDAVQKALRHWSGSKLISENLVSQLLATVQVVEEQNDFNWDRFAKYTFRVAVICFAVAIFSLLFDGIIPNIIKRIMSLPATVRVIATSAMAVAVHVTVYRYALTTPHEPYLTEAIHCLGAVLFALAALQLGIALEVDKNENVHIFHMIELALAIVYGTVAVLVQSNFIWSCGIILLANWFGSWAAYSGGVYYIALEYPQRFVLLGAAVITISSFMRDYSLTAALSSATRIWGMLFLFIALWVLSIYDVLSGKQSGRDGELRRLAFWSIAFFCAAAAAIWHGLRHGDSTTRGFGLTFLGINLYSKFFEFFWSAWYKPVFFAVLAISLGIMGRYAQSVNMALHERYSGHSASM